LEIILPEFEILPDDEVKNCDFDFLVEWFQLLFRKSN